MNKIVKDKFEAYPNSVREKMLSLRKLIYKVAKETNGVGELEETLKWGEPSYLTSKTKSGTTIRIDWKRKNPDQYAMYLNCQTSLITTFKAMFPTELKFEGNRAIIFPINEKLPKKELSICIAMALTYHLNKDK